MIEGAAIVKPTQRRGSYEQFMERNATFYSTPHDHRLYGRGHEERVQETIRLGNQYLRLQALDEVPYTEAKVGTDLSCGNGAILAALDVADRYYGDIAPGYDYCGPIDKTINECPFTDIFVCSETIEHVYHPQDLLDNIRTVTNRLLLSTPIEAWGDTNQEHYWSWNREYIELLADMAGFTPIRFSTVDSTAYGEPYKYGIWVFA